MKTFAVRRSALAVLPLMAAALLWGCNDSTEPSGGYADPVSAVDNEQWSGPGTAASDAEQAPASPGVQTAPSRAEEGTFADGIRWRREITSWTRSHTVTETDNIATVTVVEDRIGILHLRSEDGATLDRPFTDHGERQMTAERTRRGLWRVTAASIMDRRPTTDVAVPIQIDYVEFDFPATGAVMRVDDPQTLIRRPSWLRIFAGQRVEVTVKVADAGDAGARVFLHDRFAGELHRAELTQDGSDATLFHGSFVVPSPLSRPGDFRPILPLGVRWFTVDAVQATTLTMDPAVVYNARQWVVPFLYRPDFDIARD